MEEQAQFHNILDVVSADFLEDLLTRFYEATDVEALITDVQGKLLVRSKSGAFWSKFCERMRENPETRVLCERCDAFGGISAAQSKSPFLYRCHVDLVEGVVPLYVNGQYLGLISIGEVRLPKEEFMQLPRIMFPQFELDADPELKALYEESRSGLPVISMKKLRAVSALLYSLANYIAGICANSILEEANHELNMRVLQEQNQKNEMEKNLNQMYIANLKSLMNSQYLFNVLNTINNFVLTEEPERASEVVSSLSKIIRYNMKHIDRLSTIGKEVEAIRGYLNIKNAGSDKESLIDIRVDEACYDAIIPPFTIQSMLDESFLQDRESKGRARKLYLDISMTDDKVRIFISDTHSDISMASADSRNQKTAPAAEQSSETLNNAIKVLKYCFRDEFSWDVRRNDQGCLITLIIPYWEEEGGALN